LLHVPTPSMVLSTGRVEECNMHVRLRQFVHVHIGVAGFTLSNLGLLSVAPVAATVWHVAH
jgi:hypothetical protein